MRFHSNTFTIRARLLVIILVAALPAMGLSLYESIREYRHSYAQASMNLLHLAELAANNESDVVQGVHDMLTAIGESPFVKNGDRAACNRYLAKINRRYPHYHAFSIADPKGNLLCSGNPLGMPVNISDRPYFQTLLQEKRFVGAGYVVNRVTGKPVASFALPILQDGNIVGIATTALRLQSFAALVRDIRVPAQAMIAIVDAQGIVMTSKPPDIATVGKPLAGDRILASFPMQQSRVLQVIEHDGSRRLYAVAPALHEGHPVFYVIIGLDKASVIGPAVRSLLINLAALLSVVLLSLLGTWIASKYLLLRPVTKLIGAARQVAGGNLSARTGLHEQSGELGVLARHFDTMAAAVQKREEDNLASRKVIEYLADHDELTKLPNRRYLHQHLVEKLIEAKKAGSQVAVLFLDLDRFRVINDSLGHFAGDQLLIRIAERLLKHLGTQGIAARLGGDEFVCVVPQIARSADAAGIAQAIATALSQPYMLGDEKITISTSIGICLCPADTDDGPTAIKYAEVAMRRAKEAGGNAQFFSKEMNIIAVRRLTLENELRQALENNEFMLYYQPQVSLHSNRIVGAEALLRWRHPQRGIISPTTFIALAEEIRLILALGEWTLRHACVQNKAWRDAGLPPIQVAVNVSAHQFKQPGFVALVKKALEDSRLPAHSLELEVTETVLLEDVRPTLSALQTMGITLSIDDFGTGFSNLSYLRDLPADKIKIDQSFIINLAKMPGNRAIAQAIINVAKGLNLKVIAEGVDSEETSRALRAMHCDEVQGYHYGKPMPAEEFTALLRRDAGAATLA